MPYVDAETRNRVDRSGFEAGDKSGVLTYRLWRLLEEWMRDGRGGGWSYGSMNEVVGCLETAKLEFSRRYLWPYEDQKMEDHGSLDLRDI